jgi:hypothetical protein
MWGGGAAEWSGDLRRGLLLTAGGSNGPFQRARYARIYERGDELTVLGDAASRRLSGASAELARAMLDHLRQPRTRDELVAHIAEISNERAPERLGVVDEMLAILKESGAVVNAPASGPTVAAARAGDARRVVVALSGGIAAAHAPALVELLIGQGLLVRVASTPSALRFVQGMALEALTHERVVSRPWPKDPRESVPHLALARWADLVVVYPATATTLARIAQGDCSTVVSALAVSARCPVILAPAMNESMFDAPSVQRNLRALREDGFVIAHPSLGYEVALEPEERSPAFGGAPPVQMMVEITLAVLRDR